jgi:uncharacterized membrane protein
MTAVIKHPSPFRSLMKTFTWRGAVSIDTFVLSYVLSGSFVIAGSLASLEVLTKMVLYYFHERIRAHLRV